MGDTNPSTGYINVVLNDHETYTNIEGCRLLICNVEQQDEWEINESIIDIKHMGAQVIDLEQLVNLAEEEGFLQACLIE